MVPLVLAFLNREDSEKHEVSERSYNMVDVRFCSCDVLDEPKYDILC